MYDKNYILVLYSIIKFCKILLLNSFLILSNKKSLPLSKTLALYEQKLKKKASELLKLLKVLYF